MEPTRKPVSMTLLSAAATAGMLTIGVVSSGKTSAPMYPFAEQIIGRDLCCTKYDILNQPIDAPAQHRGLADPLQPGSSPQCGEVYQS